MTSLRLREQTDDLGSLICNSFDSAGDVRSDGTWELTQLVGAVRTERNQ
jgi:hypothetical protein